MASNIGFTALLLIISIGFFLPIFNFIFFKKIDIKNLGRINLYSTITIFLSSLIAKISLIYSFAISDYSVANVYNNSHHLKPLIYKISASWGNHEGSMLLLILVIALYSAIFEISSKTSIKNKIIVSSSQSFIIGLFAFFTAFASNPFKIIYPTPLSGLGLNPILQDIGLSLHPPFLYLGYIGFSLVFSYAISCLIEEKIDNLDVVQIKKWLLIPYLFLTAGICLGSWWAYRELGWGGYWFWDPVENISLLPWLMATALIHSIKLIERKNIFKSWTIFLCITTFTLCLFGIFLTRSGILTSIHSFAIDSNRAFFIIFLIATISGLAMIIFAFKINKIKIYEINNSKEKSASIINFTSLIFINNYFLMIAVFTIFVATLYPIITKAIFNDFVVIGAKFYNQVFSLLIIPFLTFLIASNGNKILTKKVNVLLIPLSIFATIFLFQHYEKFSWINFVILLLAIFSSLINFSCYKKSFMYLAHSGFSIMIVGIVCASVFSSTLELNLKVGESVKIANYDILFQEIEYGYGSNFIARQGNFLISKNDEKVAILTPQLRYYPISNQTTNESSIYHGFDGDLYVVIGNGDLDKNYAVRIYHKPFIYLIWLGCFILLSSIVMILLMIIVNHQSKNKQKILSRL